MEKISVIIPNWNGCELTLQCLRSLKDQTYDDYKIYVVENGSEDDSIERIESEFPEVALIKNSVNLGFAGGVNSGIRPATGEYIALLNNDTEAHPDWLREIVDTLDSQPEYGFAASKVLVYDQRDTIDSFGDGYSFHGLAYKIGDLAKDDGRFDESMEVFGACGAASVYRRSMLDDIGLFDEDFFAYMEDVEISIRAQLAGYRCIAVPKAKIYHMISATTGGDTSEFSVHMTSKNLINILVKIIPAPLLLLMVPLAIASQIALILLSVFTDKYPGLRKSLPGYLVGLREGFKQMPVMYRKRKDIKKIKRISTMDLVRKMRAAGIQKREVLR